MLATGKDKNELNLMSEWTVLCRLLILWALAAVSAISMCCASFVFRWGDCEIGWGPGIRGCCLHSLQYVCTVAVEYVHASYGQTDGGLWVRCSK